ncbi:hypothetical protein [Bdellovibrio bacteriovorus]|uniref:hypothetical protein n=1 Tax=Bdellovibrio TaxID=958 RepID=UPI0035A8CEBE
MSTPHCSLVIYLNKDAPAVTSFLKDLRSFFQKFPLNYELVAIIEKGASECARLLEEAKKESSAKETISLVQNSKTLHRARSLCQGFNAAQAPYVLVGDPQLATPLGDLFKILQNLMSESTVDICWGNRLNKKDSVFLNSLAPRHKLERLFNGILHERNKKSSDPLCEIGGFKKEAWVCLQEKLSTKTIKGWYLHQQLQKEIQETALNRIEIAIHDSGQTSASYSVWRERWNLLSQSIL